MPKDRRKRPKKTQTQTRTARWLRRGLFALLLLGLGYGVAALLNALYGEVPGFAVPLQASGHTPGCIPSGYNSRPPTSGCHAPNQTTYGIHEEPIPHKLQLHNLEHGAVIIQYRPSGALGADDTLVAELKDFVQRLRRQDVRYCRLILAPYPGKFAAPKFDPEELADKKIALTAWGRIDFLADFDEERIMEFIDAWINRGPEKENDC